MNGRSEIYYVFKSLEPKNYPDAIYTKEEIIYLKNNGIINYDLDIETLQKVEKFNVYE